MVDPELAQLIERLDILNPQWGEANPRFGTRIATLSNGFRLEASLTACSAVLVVMEEGVQIYMKSYSLTQYENGIGSRNSTADYAQGYTIRSNDFEYDSAKYLIDWLRPQFDAAEESQQASREQKLRESRRRLYNLNS